MHLIRVACVLPAALPFFAAAPAAAEQAAHGAPFVDRFERIDRDRWVVADGWSSGDWMANDWRAENVSTRGEGVQITLARKLDLGAFVPERLRQITPATWRQAISYAINGNQKRYSSGELISEDYYRYGYFEARMQAPRGSGLVTGFFTFGREGDESTWDEIDIEILGRDTTAMRASYWSGGRSHTVVVPLGFDAADGAHTYAFEWAPKRLRWFVDGELVHEELGEALPLPSRPQRLTFDLWNTTTLTDWLGPVRADEGPWRLSMQCVAVAERYEGRELCNSAD